MRALILSALLSASPPPSAQAQKLAARQDWDTLYLTWATVKPAGYGAAGRRTIATALAQG